MPADRLLPHRKMLPPRRLRQMDTKPIRAEMIQSYIAQLRASLGSVKPVGEKRLRELFGTQDYTGMVKVIRDNMGLDLRVRVGLVNEGGPLGAPAWVSAPKPMPRFGTAEFQRTVVTIFLRKSFVSSHYFEEVAIAIAHELSHTHAMTMPQMLLR